MRRIFVAMCALPFVACAAVAQQAQLPSEFVGEWAAIFDEGSDCKRGDFDKREFDNLIRIGRRQIEYWESVCTVQSASRKGNASNVRLSCSGEGEKWRSDEVISVQKLAKQVYLISWNSKRGYLTVYSRCS